MTIPIRPPQGPSGSSDAQPDKVTNSQALNVVGFVLLFVAIAVPISIFLWKFAITWTP